MKLEIIHPAYIVLYLWTSILNSKEYLKFGVHVIPKGTNGKTPLTWDQACRNTQRYILKDASYGRLRTVALDRGLVKIVEMWDATAYFTKLGMTGTHDKQDDYMRKLIGFRVKSLIGNKVLRGDVHYGISTDEFCAKVQTELIKHGQPLPILRANVLQYMDVLEILKAIRQGNNRILAELATRYGKTNVAGMLIRELKSKLTVVASYWLACFASFENEFTKWEQFRDFVLVDSSIEGFEKKLQKGLDDGKQVVVYLGMCNGELRPDRIRHIFNREQRPLVVIDEADYGIHRIKQVDALQAYLQKDDIIFAMTGSNGDRAAQPWNTNYYIHTGYNDMVTEKHFPVKTKPTGLKFFEVDMELIKQTVDVVYLQADLSRVADEERTKNPAFFEEEGKYLPGWTKWSKNPTKASHFADSTLRSVYGKATKKGNLFRELNIVLQQQSLHLMPKSNDITVDMWWLPGNTRKDNLKIIEQQFNDALPGHRILVLSGMNGHTNRNAEREVNEFIASARADKKNVVLLSTTIAARSFSIKEIGRIFLAMDGGSLAAIKQKCARAYTSLMSDLYAKTALVISLSFDPQRDDKFDPILIEAVENAQKRHPEVKDIYELWEEVLRTNPCYLMSECGAKLLLPDEYLKLAQDRHSLHRVLGNLFVVGDLDTEVQEALLAGNAASFLKATTKAAERGKTTDVKKARLLSPKQRSESLSRESKVKEVVTMISENLDILINYAGKDKTFEEVFAYMDRPAHREAREAVKEEFGVDYAIIKWLVLEKKMKRILLDLGRRMKS